jgi:hypothetical protein
MRANAVSQLAKRTFPQRCAALLKASVQPVAAGKSSRNMRI